MQQALHIFKKDTRYLRFEICLVVLLAGAFLWLWPIAAAYLIARLIHAEAIPGDNQFWITRPYRWTSLITAKLLFIGAFINLPVFLVQLYQTVQHGFALKATWPGLMWSQVLMILCLSLPAAALAAITPGMVGFMFLELIAVAVVFGLGQFSFLGLTSFRVPWPIGLEWISDSFIIGVTAAAAISILVLQFYRRKTFTSRVTAASAFVTGVAIFLFLPPQLALNAEARLTKAVIDTSSVELARASEPMSLRMVGQGSSSQAQLTIPILLIGNSPEVDVRVDGLAGTFQGTGGSTSAVFTNGADTRVDSAGNVIFKTVVFVHRPFFQAQRDRAVTLHASVYFSLFGDARSQTIAQQTESRSVMDRLQCSTGELDHLVQFRCVSAFRWPGEMIYAQIREKDPISFHELISYSPFPAELSLTPFEFHSALGTQGLAPPSPLGVRPVPPVTIIAKRAVAHVKRELEVRDIRFGELSDGGVGGRRPPPPPPRPPAPPANQRR